MAEFLKSVGPDEWRELCRDAEISHCYLDPRWLELIASVYPAIPLLRLVCRDPGGSAVRLLLPLVAIRPLLGRTSMLISLPFANYGGLLLPRGQAEPTEGEAQALAGFFASAQAGIMEIRAMFGTLPGFTAGGDYRRFVLEIGTDSEALFAKIISGNARTCIRKANSLGIEILWDEPRRLQTFCRLNELHAASHGTPLHHRHWYPRLVSLYGDQCAIGLARHQGHFVAAVLLLTQGRNTVLHAMVRDPAHTGVPALDSLLWSALERCALSGGGLFDFGRTRPVAGQLFFKRKWGAQETPFPSSYLVKPGAKVPKITPENPGVARAIALWRLLPIPVQRHLGPWLRVRIPT